MAEFCFQFRQPQCRAPVAECFCSAGRLKEAIDGLKTFPPMKINVSTFALLSLTVLLLEGCVAFPPLVQVEHKDNANSSEVLRRLDAIDRRLSRLEHNGEKSP